MAITPPSNLAAVAATTSKINLSWTNPQAYIGIEVQRSPNGSTGWAVVSATLGGSTTSWSDASCQDGTKYYYRLEVAAGEESDYSNTANATTPLAAPGALSGTSASDGTEVDLTWTDNCQNETGFKVYKDGVLLATLGANVTAYTATGLTAGRTYAFHVTAYNSLVTSQASNTLRILTDDPPAAPTGLTSVATSTTTVQLNWTDNADNETRFYVEKSSTSASAGFAVVGTYLAANVTTYEVDSLSSNTQYWFRVRAYNSSGYSAYCAVATAVTWAAIAAPTNLVVVDVNGLAVDLYFDDNSSEEDGHSVEMKTGAGAYSELVELEPNRNCYRATSLSAGTLYTFKVRARQGVSYSGYCDEVAITTATAPSAPSGLAVSEYQDTWVKLTWTPITGAVGYKVQYSTNGVDYVSAGAVPFVDLPEYKVTGLTASTPYWFKVQAKNIRGWGSLGDAVEQTTRASFSFSTFQKLIRKSSPNLIYLVELNPAMALQGWALSSGQTYTYEISFDEGGAELESVEENGTALTEQSSISTVEATAGTWWHDTANSKVYVHPTGNDSPNNYTFIGDFWLYFTTWSRKDDITEFSGNLYLPLVSEIPDITQEISPLYEGNFIITHGSISFLNGQIVGENYWDDKFGKYLFLNRKARVLAGGEDFAYTDYVTVNTGIMDSYECSDQRFTLNLRDSRDGINRTLPIAKYTVDEFSALDPSAEGKCRPFGYGAITNAIPTCIDTTNRIFEFHNGRIKSVEYVYQNGATLTAGTDYFIDYQRGRIVLARGLTYSSDDVILVDFTGWVTLADDTISTGSGIFKHLMNEYLDIDDNNLDLPSIVATYVAKSTALSLYVWKEMDSQDLIRRIERSIEATTFQAPDGTLGIKTELSTAPSDIFYIPDADVLDFGMSKSKDSIFSQVNIFYGEDPSTDTYNLQVCGNAQLNYKHKISQTLKFHTALTTAALATALGANIIALLDRAKISFTVPRLLFTHQPGDLVYFNRTRFYDDNPVASNKLLRIMAVSKSFSTGRTGIVAEVV
jgi:hypothetical protein